MLWLLPVAGAAAGAYKGQEDSRQAKKDRIAQAEVARWSPWTGMSPHQVQRGPGALGGAFQGAVGGAGLMQAFGAAKPVGSAEAVPSTDYSAETSQMSPDQMAQQSLVQPSYVNPNGQFMDYEQYSAAKRGRT